MSDKAIAGTSAAEAQRVAMMATAGGGVVTLGYWGLWEWTGLLIVGGGLAIGIAATAGLAAAWAELAFGESDDEHNRPSRLAILASSLGTWAVILGAFLALVRLVRGLFSSAPLVHPDWAFWLSIVPMLLGIALAVFVIKDKAYFESTRVRGITGFPTVLAGSGVGVLVLLGMAHFGGMTWLDALGGALLAWAGLGLLWAGLWRQFNRLTGLDTAPAATPGTPNSTPDTPPAAPALDPTDLQRSTPPPTADPAIAPESAEPYPSDTEDLSPIELAGDSPEADDTPPDRDPPRPTTGQA